jgi:hypothetical protein
MDMLEALLSPIADRCANVHAALKAHTFPVLPAAKVWDIAPGVTSLRDLVLDVTAVLLQVPRSALEESGINWLAYYATLRNEAHPKPVNLHAVVDFMVRTPPLLCEPAKGDVLGAGGESAREKFRREYVESRSEVRRLLDVIERMQKESQEREQAVVRLQAAVVNTETRSGELARASEGAILALKRELGMARDEIRIAYESRNRSQEKANRLNTAVRQTFEVFASTKNDAVDYLRELLRAGDAIPAPDPSEAHAKAVAQAATIAQLQADINNLVTSRHAAREEANALRKYKSAVDKTLAAFLPVPGATSASLAQPDDAAAYLHECLKEGGVSWPSHLREVLAVESSTVMPRMLDEGGKAIPPSGIHTNPDAQVWARAFVAFVKGRPDLATDEGYMVGWFANAMMAMHDFMAGQRQKAAYAIVGHKGPGPILDTVPHGLSSAASLPVQNLRFCLQQLDDIEGNEVPVARIRSTLQQALKE